MNRRFIPVTIMWGILICPCTARAQNINDYASFSDAYVFLLREPAVWEELECTPRQREAIVQANVESDGSLLALRGLPLDGQRSELKRQTAAARTRMNTILDARQRERLEQIRLQVRGIQALAEPPLDAQLHLDESQTGRIRDVLGEMRDRFTQLFQQAATAPATESSAWQDKARELYTQSQQQIVSILSAPQQTALRDAIGRTFDAAKLGRVRFRIPDFPAGGTWFNADALRASDLRGRVVALHFWTFG